MTENVDRERTQQTTEHSRLEILRPHQLLLMLLQGQVILTIYGNQEKTIFRHSAVQCGNLKTRQMPLRH